MGTEAAQGLREWAKGSYAAEAAVEMANPEQWSWRRDEGAEDEGEQPTKIGGTAWCVARTRFEIDAVPLPKGLPPGTCIATWEGDYMAGGIATPDGKSGDWRTMLDWCEYVGADTFWFRAAVTQPHGPVMSFEQPFHSTNLEVVPKLAAEAHRRGIKFGAWAVAYSTYPKPEKSRPNFAFNKGKPPYEFTRDISVGTGVVSERNFISLLDERRIDHLAQFVADMNAIPDVDFIGFDYFRTDSPTGGYEMTDRFTSEMPVSLPDDWANMSEKARMRHVARCTGKDWQKNIDFFDAWNWWRAHRGAMNLRSILQRAKPTKPTWIFVLSWEHGKQHGQDPVMFTDAGLTFVAPMLYEVESPQQFDTVAEAWNEYLYAFVFLNDKDMFTMPIAINRIFNDPRPRPHVVMAASTAPIITSQRASRSVPSRTARGRNWTSRCTASSAMASAGGFTTGDRNASTAWVNASIRLWPYPRFSGCSMTATSSYRRSSRGVSSVEPSLMTSTSKPCARTAASTRGR